MATAIVTSKRPILALPFLLPSLSESVAIESRRSQSSYRRSKPRLRVKPDASFGPSSDQSQEHIIYNPPSSAPSVYQTPSKFLPADDVRRTLHPKTSSNGSECFQIDPRKEIPPGSIRYRGDPQAETQRSYDLEPMETGQAV